MHFLLHFLFHFLTRTVGRGVADFLLRPFLGFLDGSDGSTEPQPLYSVAEARRKQGRYLEARDHVRSQLDQFPADFHGQMLLAEIEAHDLHDLAAAELVIQRLISQKGHSPAHLFYALNTLADWHLKYANDCESALRCFKQVVALFPESEWALRAAQRMAHLPDAATLMDSELRSAIKVPHPAGDAGLKPGRWRVTAGEMDPTDLATKLVTRLENFPLDWEAREELVRIYAEQFQRLDLAESQLEQLIQYPNQPAKQVVKWLNLLADLQVKHGGTCDVARATLQRIIDLYPDAAAANVTRNRIERLRLEFKGKEKSQAVTLGSYEEDLGLKRRLPH